MLIDRGAVTGDFNNYLSPGIYRYTGSSSVGNNPGDVAGNLEVIVTSSYVIHRFTAYNRMYTRRYDGSSWTDWTSYVINADLKKKNVSGSVTNYGNISLQLTTPSIVLGTRIIGNTGINSLPFTNGIAWYAYMVRNTAGTTINFIESGTEVEVEVYYIDQ